MNATLENELTTLEKRFWTSMKEKDVDAALELTAILAWSLAHRASLRSIKRRLQN